MEKIDELIQTARELRSLLSGFREAEEILIRAAEIEDTVTKRQGTLSELDAEIAARKQQLASLDKTLEEQGKRHKVLEQGIRQFEAKLDEFRKIRKEFTE